MYENPSEVRELIRQGKLIRPTAGGYAKIATVVTVDLMKLAQAKPGDKGRFQSIETAQAISLLKEREKTLSEIQLLFERG